MILCCGEALIDMLPVPLGGAGRTGFDPHPGGAVFNTARALGRLGVRAGYFGGLSQDMFGDMLRAALDEAGVNYRLAPIVDRPTTLAFVARQEGHTRYAFHDENTAGRMLSQADLPELPDAVRLLFLGGISLVAEPSGTTFEALALREGGRRLIMLDPNIRPGFIHDESAFRARIARLIAVADIVKLSDEDLAWLSGSADMQAAGALLNSGPLIVVVTRGAEGATALMRSDTAVQVPSPRVRVVDTIGAGDIFNAGLLAGLQRSGALSGGRAGLGAIAADVLEDALDLANRAAAVSVMRKGASSPRLDEVEAMT